MEPWATLALGALLGVAVPWVGMRMLVPSLAEGKVMSNYRGRQVFLGLGVVWLLWSCSAILAGAGASALGQDRAFSTLSVLTLAGLLALVAFALGMVDDAFGTGAARGFSGHLRALARGRLTTGGAKLFGISLAALIVAVRLARIAPWGVTVQGSAWYVRFAVALVAGAAIALTSNFVNLTDLRPGRALKVYGLLAAVGVLSTGVLLPVAHRTAGAGDIAGTFAAQLAVLTLFAAGPLLAVYRYDVRELGMLGDAGANPMGAVAGLLIVAGLPLWGLALYAGVVLALNLISERVSFSRVIAKNPLLSRLDALGREPDTTNPSEFDAPEGRNLE